MLIENLHLEAAAACADDPCEAALALTGVRDKVVVWGRHVPPGTDAKVGPREDGHLCRVQEAIVREWAR